MADSATHTSSPDSARPGLRYYSLARATADACRVLAAQGPLRVYAARAGQVPGLLRAIGVERERAFAAVGEGTGDDSDTDRFDEHYLQLVLWDGDRGRIAGGYRVAEVDTVVRRFGPEGLYTSTLFDMDECLYQDLGHALELGRSFIVAEYQRSHAALGLLWQAIGRLVAERPCYSCLIGPVTLSNAFSAESQRLVSRYLCRHHAHPTLASRVRPRWPHAGTGGSPVEPIDAVADSLEGLAALEQAVARLERGRRGLPVLLKRYLGLGARVLGINRDPDFGNCLDALCTVELERAPARHVRRFAGAHAQMVIQQKATARCAEA